MSSRRHPTGSATVPEAEPAGHPPVVVRGLTKRFGPVTAVNDATFTVRRGTVTALLGANGAGKSTLVGMVLGLIAPTSGEASVFGRRYRDLHRPLRRVGAVVESTGFHPSRTGGDHLRALARAGDIDETRLADVLGLVGLDAAAPRPVGTYSLGMRQRLGLAAALLGQPDLLVLDEPANGLDPAGVRWLRDLLVRFAADGGTALVSSHQLAETALSADRIVIVHHGRVLADDTTAALTGGGRSLEDVFLDLTATVPT